jgi:hypothetical protein
MNKLQSICFHPVVEKKIRLECEYKLDKISLKVIRVFRLNLDVDESLDNPIRNSVFEKLKYIYGEIKISKSISRAKIGYSNEYITKK